MSAPRIVALTRNVPLVVGLTMRDETWEFLNATDAGSAPAMRPTDLLLIDQGTTDAGLAELEAIRERGAAGPAVVIGDWTDSSGRARVVTRPFTLDDLVEVLREVARQAADPGPRSSGGPGSSAASAASTASATSATSATEASRQIAEAGGPGAPREPDGLREPATAHGSGSPETGVSDGESHALTGQGDELDDDLPVEPYEISWDASWDSDAAGGTVGADRPEQPEVPRAADEPALVGEPRDEAAGEPQQDPVPATGDHPDPPAALLTPGRDAPPESLWPAVNEDAVTRADALWPAPDKADDATDLAEVDEGADVADVADGGAGVADQADPTHPTDAASVADAAASLADHAPGSAEGAGKSSVQTPPVGLDQADPERPAPTADPAQAAARRERGPSDADGAGRDHHGDDGRHEATTTLRRPALGFLDRVHALERSRRGGEARTRPEDADWTRAGPRDHGAWDEAGDDVRHGDGHDSDGHDGDGHDGDGHDGSLHDRDGDGHADDSPRTQDTGSHGIRPVSARDDADGADGADGANLRVLARRVLGRVAPHRGGGLDARVSAALRGARELRDLVRAVPALRSRADVAVGLLDELVEALQPETAGVWAVDGDELFLLAGYGLSTAESQLRIPGDQPLAAELLETGGAVLLSPTGLAQAAVAGIGGAHTEAFMGAGIAILPDRFGIVTVGAATLRRGDMDRMAELAVQAAPAFAIAAVVEELSRGRVTTPVPSVRLLAAAAARSTEPA